MEVTGYPYKFCVTTAEVRVYLNDAQDPKHGYTIPVNTPEGNAMLAALIAAKANHWPVRVHSGVSFSAGENTSVPLEYIFIDK